MTFYLYNPDALPSQYKYIKFVKTGDVYAYECSNNPGLLARRQGLQFRNRTSIRLWGSDREVPINSLIDNSRFIYFTEDSHPEYFI